MSREFESAGRRFDTQSQSFAHWALRKGQLNRHTRYRPATTTRNTATQWSRRSEGGFPQEKGQQIFERTERPLGTDYRLWQLARAKLSEIHFPKSPLRRSTMCDDLLFEKGSVESTHKVPTSHYHAKHRLALRSRRTPSLGGLTHRRPARIFKDPAPTPTSQSVPPTPPTALRRPLRPAASSPAVRSRLLCREKKKGSHESTLAAPNKPISPLTGRTAPSPRGSPCSSGTWSPTAISSPAPPPRWTR